MKTFFKLFFFFLIVAISCKQESTQPSETTKSSKNSSVSSSVSSSMYNDPDYIALNNLSYKLVTQMLPNADLHYLINQSGTISQTQFVYTVQQMGFKDTTAYRAFQNQQIPLQQRLHAKYFSGGGGASLSSSSQQGSPNFQNPCQAAFSSCMHQASADYTFRVLDCTGLAIGIGSVSAGVGGILFQLGCGAVSIYYLNQSRGDCQASFDAC